MTYIVLKELHRGAHRSTYRSAYEGLDRSDIPSRARIP